MIDSGNLYGDVISEELAKKLKMRIYGPASTVGIAKDSASLEILGKVRPFNIYLEGLAVPIKVSPQVARGLAHPINLGQAMLRCHEADLIFRPNDIQLKIKGTSIPLHPKHTSLTRPSVDVRLVRVLDQWTKSLGGNPPAQEQILDARLHHISSSREPDDPTGPLPGLYKECYKRAVWIKDTQHSVRTMQAEPVPPRSSRKVELTFHKHSFPPTNSNWVYFEMNAQKVPDLGGNVLIHPGIYPRQGHIISVAVSNLGTEPSCIPANMKIGKICESDGLGEDPAIYALTHKPQAELSPAEVDERKKFIKESLDLGDQVSELDRQKLESVFLDHFDALSINEHDFGKTNLLKFHIQVPKGVTPVRAKCRPLNPSQEADLRRQLDEWISQGVIEPSMSPWASALVAVTKRTGGIRWCCDFRALNSHTVADSFPLPNIDANLHKLGKAKLFSSLDARGAFYSLEVEPGSRDYTTFTSPFGSYRWLRLPFGVKNGPAAYSRLIMMALQSLPPGFTLAYIDDIIIYSRNMEEHIEHIRSVLGMHVRFGMKLNLAKCHMAKDQIEYLGHLVGEKGIRMIPSYVDRVLEWTLPTTAPQLRSFLGFTGYYRGFIRKYGELTVRLNAHRNDKDEIKWTEREIQDFEDLKKAFKEQPVRGFPDYESPNPFILDTDWSSTNMAAVLSQLQDGSEKFIGCVAKKCSKTEENYPSHKGELASVILGLKKFEHILRAKEFTIRTDSRCLEFLNTLKDPRGIYARWLTYLSTFEYKVVHRKGTLQTNADALSRMPGLDPHVEADGLDVGLYEDIADVHAIASGEELPVSLNQHDEVSRATQSDPALGEVLSWIRTGHVPNKEERKRLTKQGLAYANVLNTLSERQGVVYSENQDGTLRLCLPERLWDSAFRACHAHATCGHIGTNATLTKFKSRFFFPGMRSYVIRKLQTCLPCLKKNKEIPSLAHAQHHEYSSYFGQRVCIDTVGPLNRTQYRKRSVNHILTMQDSFTRYLVAVPIEDLEAKTVAFEVVEHWALKFGVPEQIHTDRGVSFTSRLFLEVMSVLGIKKTVTPPYCPRGDRVERAHRVLGAILRSDERGQDRDWAIKLPEAALAYNIATNRVTGVSPFEAVFGQKAVLPVDFLFPCPKQRQITMADFIEVRRGQMKEMVQRMLQQEYKTIQTDPRYRPRQVENPLKEGDVVYMFTTRLTPKVASKLQSPWTGPWTVHKVISLSLVEVIPKGTWCKHTRTVTTTIDRLKPVDVESLTQKDLHPIEQLELEADGLLIGDEDEDEVVLPSPGIYDPIVPDEFDIAEPLPAVELPVEAKEEVQDEFEGMDDEPEVQIPEGIPSENIAESLQTPVDTSQSAPRDDLGDTMLEEGNGLPPEAPQLQRSPRGRARNQHPIPGPGPEPLDTPRPRRLAAQEADIRRQQQQLSVRRRGGFFGKRRLE